MTISVDVPLTVLVISHCFLGASPFLSICSTASSRFWIRVCIGVPLIKRCPAHCIGEVILQRYRFVRSVIQQVILQRICIPLLDDLKLLLIEMSRLEGIGAFAWRYLYMRAWCSSSIHWEGVKGLLVLDSRKACSFGLPRSKPR